ncbi:hypothetical protein K504DRAFT_479547 [Pleomassaria siparia CBS 279.74]|uniref:FAD/NAD(P)-binding domain-containing protein n=1 Tax=Pleomassaria siparia CBS 279.74 TaxID=1314801 RepID=A0A6G1KME7_9PLEO|nr:hypothetical protein K504DRAFT_479547 [Pleomassaria siparia CBS 279.74]
MSVHEILVLGGNFGGFNVVHHLQRQVLPILKKSAGDTTFHITLVTPNSHFFFKIAAPRALINAELIPEEKIFKPLSEAFKQYKDSVTVVQGKAVGLSSETRTVSVELVGGAGSNELKYDSLFIATGTNSASPLWTLHDDHKITIDALHKLHAALPNAKTVLVSGGGPVGVETSGEIAAAYPTVKVTLVSGGEILSTLKAGNIAKAKKLLADAKVEIVNARVTKTYSEGASTVVELDKGEARTVDIYIDGRGVEKVNSEYIPKTWLDATGRVTTRDSYFRVKGDNQADVSNTYAVGDIVAGSTNTAIELDAQVATAASSFAVDVLKKLGAKAGGSGGLLSFIPGLGGKSLAQKEFKPMKDTIVVPIGPNGGVGQVLGWSLPSFAVKKGKAEKFLLELCEPVVTGTKFAQV